VPNRRPDVSNDGLEDMGQFGRGKYEHIPIALRWGLLQEISAKNSSHSGTTYRKRVRVVARIVVVVDFRRSIVSVCWVVLSPPSLLKF